ncbi:hypothetical protein GUJ93_ZPchr0012g20820 [Zizania palustris]|uniref:Uncharacterized protein n=1 Tax=Zizania palustris TaxID=103762 RepID=A0A8J5WTS3_ZIZPA|nr:hypothetical protein GUJ93_ZPchr0012g20820 [Zizania palustris]
MVSYSCFNQGPAKKHVSRSNKPLSTIATNSNNSDDSDGSSSDEAYAKKPDAPLKKPVAPATNGSKKKPTASVKKPSVVQLHLYKRRHMNMTVLTVTLMMNQMRN